MLEVAGLWGLSREQTCSPPKARAARAEKETEFTIKAMVIEQSLGSNDVAFDPWTENLS